MMMTMMMMANQFQVEAQVICHSLYDKSIRVLLAQQLILIYSCMLLL